MSTRLAIVSGLCRVMSHEPDSCIDRATPRLHALLYMQAVGTGYGKRVTPGLFQC